MRARVGSYLERRTTGNRNLTQAFAVDNVWSPRWRSLCTGRYTDHDPVPTIAMRYVAVALSCTALLSCGAPSAPRELLDGVWKIESAQSPLDPRVLTLVQHGTLVEGSGNAMGVDAPMPLTVDGLATGSHLALTFRFGNGDGLTGKYTATFNSRGRLAGVAVFPDFGVPSHSLAYIRK